MKTKNSIKNSISSIITNVITIIIGFIAQKIFINILGSEYLGINGVFTNIISMLCLVEVGFGPAIVYNLYKPIHDNDIETIKSLLKFYKKIYTIVAIIILLFSFILMPFLPFFITDISIDINLNLIYILFVIDSVCSYLLAYKRSVLYANQKNYIINIIHILYILILNIVQILILVYTKNYYLYLISKIIIGILENIVIVLFVNKKYNYVLDKNVKSLDKNIENDIFTKVKALIVHKIAGFVITGTDNIIISKFIGIIVVGLYSNYYLIIKALNVLFGQAITALTPSLGHLLVEKDYDKNYQVFKKVRFINFWIVCITGTGLLLVMQSFITLWLGSEYLLGISTLLALVLNHYSQLTRNTYMTFKEAAGIYYEDRRVPIVESITNIVASIILVKLIGLPGVFIGTFISSLVLWLYSYPKYVYKKLFNRSYKKYADETIKYFILFILISLISFVISKIINPYSFIINVIITMLVPNIILFILYRKTDEFNYYKDLFMNLTKIRKKI